MKTRSLLLASIAVTGLLTDCGTYPLGVPLGLTRAEINALPPAKRTAVLKLTSKQQTETNTLASSADRSISRLGAKPHRAIKSPSIRSAAPTTASTPVPAPSNSAFDL